jgi:hypothetical protein
MTDIISDAYSKIEGYPYEVAVLTELVNRFSDKMWHKLIRKLDQGYYGWDDPFLKKSLQESLIKHIEKGFDAENMVDVANLAAMLWNLETRW